jgi:hypothetical protein
MSEDRIVTLKGVVLPENASNEMAEILERMAEKARNGEFVSMVFCGLMKNHNSYTAWHITNKSDVFTTIGATQSLINDMINNSSLPD